MCVFNKPKMPPMPEPIPAPPPPLASNATTKRDAPKNAKSTSSSVSKTSVRKKAGRGTLRIPLSSSGLSQSGVNFPTS